MRTAMLRNRQLTGGLTMFFFQYLVQAGFFFVVPLFLSVALGLSAIDTGVRLLPLSVTLLAAAIGIPRFLPHLSPRLVVRVGLLSLLAGTVVLLGALDADAGPEVVFVPMLLVGLGIGALASQLGAVTVSAVPDDESPEVGGVQNTMTNLGASLGTALAGSLMIASLTSAFLANIAQSPAIPDSAKEQAQVELAGGVAFVSDADLEAALEDAGAEPAATDAALDAYADARLDGLRAALAILAVLAVVALFLAQSIPTRPDRRRRTEGVAMCRWLAYSGSPIRLEELLVKRDRSLIDQSLHSRLGATTTNGDGFGVGWYDDGGSPRLYRSTHPAWNDRNLRELAAGVSSPLFFAHIRASTGTAIQETNTHPFRHGRWLWMHNGLIREFARMPCELLAAVDDSLFPRSRGRPTRRRCSSSRSRSGSRTTRSAVARMVGFVEETGRKHGVEDPVQMTIATTDGRTVWAFRYSSEGDSRSLYFSTRLDALKAAYPELEELAGLSDETRVVVSEPLGDLAGRVERGSGVPRRDRQARRGRAAAVRARALRTYVTSADSKPGHGAFAPARRRASRPRPRPGCTPSRAGCRRGSARPCTRARTPSRPGTPPAAAGPTGAPRARGTARTGACRQRGARAPRRRGLRTPIRARRGPRTRRRRTAPRRRSGRSGGSSRRAPFAAGEPRRRGGEERERDEGHPGEQGDAADVVPEAVAGDEPEQAREQVGRDEIAHVDRPGRVVVPTHVGSSVPELLLEPHGRNGVAEEECIRLELRPVPGGEEESVGAPAQKVVDREDERKRQPFEDDAPRPAEEIVVESASRPSTIQISSRSRPTGIPSSHMYALSAAT